MVLIGGVKYACERCIRGHRVTTCNHTDQPLMMIKPKGRPSSQCKHCKEMRKNKNSHPSGACTCGKNKKTTSSSVSKCSCKTGEVCSCHSKRKKTESRSSLSTTQTRKSPSSDDPSVGSFSHQTNGSNSSLPTSSSFNWRNNSYSSSISQQNSQSQIPTTHQGLQQNGSQDSRIRQIGMDPLTNAKPISDSTRTRVGEVSVPINEYIPNNSNGIGNVNDKMPDVFFQDIPFPFEPGHGLLDLFANNNNTTSLNPYFHPNPKSDLTHQHAQHQYNELRSPSEASNTGSHNSLNNNINNNNNNNTNGQYNGLFNHMNNININNNNNNSNNSNNTNGNTNGQSSFNNQLRNLGSPEPRISNNNFQRTDSAMSLSSIGSNSQMSKVNGSSDSLTSGNNYHHYDSMIHKNSQNFSFPNNSMNNNNNNNNSSISQVHQNQFNSGLERNNSIQTTNTNNNDDAASVQSVEVLSLTPSFMDIPTDFHNEKGYFSNNHNGNGNSNGNANNVTNKHFISNPTNNENFRNHRFTPSVDSIQSGSSATRLNTSNGDHTSTIPQVHSNLIDGDTAVEDENIIPRELQKTNSADSNFTNDSIFNSFNTKLTTSGL